MDKRFVMLIIFVLGVFIYNLHWHFFCIEVVNWEGVGLWSGPKKSIRDIHAKFPVKGPLKSLNIFWMKFQEMRYLTSCEFLAQDSCAQSFSSLTK